MRTTTCMLALALSCAAACASAAAGRIESVQAPAWLERGGRAVPLAAGLELEAQDKVVTGANARVRVVLPEGSAVKLGENAQVVIERAEDRGLFRAALAVIDGAFRFTTDPRSIRRDRDIAIKVRNASIGIRGTDLWGKASATRDWVVLFEGRITASVPGFPQATLERPNDMYVVERGSPPYVVGAVPADIEAWSRETEMPPDAADAEKAPAWKVVAAIHPDREAARAMARQLRSAGYAAEVQAIEGYQLVQVPRLETEAQAREVMGNLRAQPGVTLPKVVPMR